MIIVDCKCFRGSDNGCTHQAAPRKLVGLPKCILTIAVSDPRYDSFKCKIQVPFPKPQHPPKAP